MSIESRLDKLRGASMMEVSLSDLIAGECAHVVSFAPAGEAREKLLRLGVVPGIGLRVESVSENGGSVEITIMGSRVSIGKADADEIKVKRFE